MSTPEQHDGTEGSAVDLSPEFLEAVRRWENAPHNQPGTDKTWVERLIKEWHRHYRLAKRVR